MKRHAGAGHFTKQEVIMDTPAIADYVLGHSDAELRRLALQSAFWGELTEEVFRRAGIGAGMHVLDVGCGAGDVSFLAARLVGPSGTVLGIDRSEDAVEKARSRARAQGLDWCHFAVSDANTFQTNQHLDAIVGRLVLLYLGDPARTLRELARHLRPGGIVAFHELILRSMGSVSEPAPLISRVVQWVTTAFERAAVEVDMGLKLDATFRAAGLPAPETHVEARLAADSASPAFDILADLTRSLLPAIEKFGIATPAEVDIDTLAQRLRDARDAADACWLSPVLVGAWARVGA
jgi:SAM-dependent methyltransferase